MFSALYSFSNYTHTPHTTVSTTHTDTHSHTHTHDAHSSTHLLCEVLLARRELKQQFELDRRADLQQLDVLLLESTSTSERECETHSHDIKHSHSTTYLSTAGEATPMTSMRRPVQTSPSFDSITITSPSCSRTKHTHTSVRTQTHTHTQHIHTSTQAHAYLVCHAAGFGCVRVGDGRLTALDLGDTGALR